MSRTTVAINKIKQNIDSISGLGGAVADFMEGIEQITRIYVEEVVYALEIEDSEKQAPRQVEYEEYETTNGDLIMTNRNNYKCPNCRDYNAIFDYNGQGLDYCGKCGQKLRWKE